MESYFVVVAFCVVLFSIVMGIIQYLDKCKHDWNTDHTTTESKMEQCSRLKYEVSGRGVSYLTEKKHITIMTCKKCGQVKRFVEEI